jgi:hypothetical protein
MVLVPIDADTRQRAWRQQLAYVGLPESTPMPIQREPVGFGAGPARSGHEPLEIPRPRPSPRTMRTEAPRGTAAERIWPDLAKERR